MSKQVVMATSYESLPAYIYVCINSISTLHQSGMQNCTNSEAPSCTKNALFKQPDYSAIRYQIAWICSIDSPHGVLSNWTKYATSAV